MTTEEARSEIPGDAAVAASDREEELASDAVLEGEEASFLEGALQEDGIPPPTVTLSLQSI